jgi:hypothetical protein
MEKNDDKELWKMVTAIHIIKLIIKLLLLIIFLPFFLIWVIGKYLIFKNVLIRNSVASGLPKESAKALAKSASLRQLTITLRDSVSYTKQNKDTADRDIA